MQILIFYPQDLSDPVKEQVRRSLFSPPANRLLIKMLKVYNPFRVSSCRLLIPRDWPSLDPSDKEVGFYDPADPWFPAFAESFGRSDGSYRILSNAAVLTDLDTVWLQSTISTFAWDVLAVRVDPTLGGSREQVKLTGRDRIVGFRRQYRPSAEPDSPSAQWPDHLLLTPRAWEQLKRERRWNSCPSFFDVVRHAGMKCRWIRVGGRRNEVFSPAGQMELLRFSQCCSLNGDTERPEVDPSVRIYGKIHQGPNVKIEAGTVVVAPAILCEGARIGAHSMLRDVFVGSCVQVSENSRLQRQAVIHTPEGYKGMLFPDLDRCWIFGSQADSVFRLWPVFSYARFGKRLFDLLASILILSLFLPFFPIIALAIKLTSSGPVFYRARRQGLHGREFDCLKFRTMMEQAESMQELLRFASQVDGPQFKIEDDPRISPIGKFLRDTCIDELPQFLNVLAGQMSIVGPRPSPESENEFCPAWRDARLSVRPGITGMWQVCRTRGASMDFQEWIYYDTEYVRRLSFRTDLWVCLQTAKKLISQFLDQFG
jgi:lipopolysaccharide/colanic/teichoic acid biosynthesis glycosyltransferase